MSDIKMSRAAEIKNLYAESEEQNPEIVEMGAVLPGAVTHKKSKGPKIFLSLVLIVILVLVGLLVISKITNWNILNLVKTPVAPVGEPIAKASDWQAVFLTNGQVYFGKLKNATDPYPVLEDIYYLQVQQTPIQPAQPASETGGTVQPAEQTQQQLILVKFGTELHRPMDKMFLNKDHMMFFEDLSQESAVVKAIENYKAQQGGK